MSRMTALQPGLDTPDEALGDEDGTDGGVGEKKARGMVFGRDQRAKNAAAVCPRRLALPKPEIRRVSDLLTPQGKDLNPWYLKKG
jgi:hypothetical protein